MGYRITDIEDHVTDLHIKGFQGFYDDLGRHAIPMTIHGTVDGRKFSVKTTGNMTIGEIVNEIVKVTR